MVARRIRDAFTTRRRIPQSSTPPADATASPAPVDPAAAHIPRHQPLVQLMERKGCGSCVRVYHQIADLVEQYTTPLERVDVDEDPQLAAEYGDRVPVVVIDGEEFSCWEVDSDELARTLLAAVE